MSGETDAQLGAVTLHRTARSHVRVTADQVWMF